MDLNSFKLLLGIVDCCFGFFILFLDLGFNQVVEFIRFVAILMD